MNIETITRVPQTQTHTTPLLFIHGMWHGAWRWDEFFLPFFAEAGYHVTALSLRGHAGNSSRSSAPPTGSSTTRPTKSTKNSSPS